MRVDTNLVSQREHETTPVLRSSPKWPAHLHPRAQALRHLAAMPSIAPEVRVPAMARPAAVRAARLQPPEQGPPARGRRRNRQSLSCPLLVPVLLSPFAQRTGVDPVCQRKPRDRHIWFKAGFDQTNIPAGSQRPLERPAFVRSCRSFVAHGLDGTLFDLITGQREARAMRVGTGTLMDATSIASASEEDGEGHGVKHRGRPAVHGFEAHIGADTDTALVENIAVTPAAVYDGTVFFYFLQARTRRTMEGKNSSYRQSPC